MKLPSANLIGHKGKEPLRATNSMYLTFIRILSSPITSHSSCDGETGKEKTRLTDQVENYLKAVPLKIGTHSRWGKSQRSSCVLVTKVTLR